MGSLEGKENIPLENGKLKRVAIEIHKKHEEIVETKVCSLNKVLVVFGSSTKPF